MEIDHTILKDKLIKNKDGFWEVEGLPEGDYDGQASKYDKLVGSILYNKIMWGNSPMDYAKFALKNLNDSDPGRIVDVGCGSLIFTHQVYSDYKKQNLILSDHSAEMLRIGKKKLERHSPNNNPKQFLRLDALNMPFHEGSIQTILSFGLLHILKNPSNLLLEFNRILNKSGRLHITSLCTDRKISAKYLSFLHEKSHVASPLNSLEISSLIEANGFTIIDSYVKGGMMYVSAIK